MIHQPLLQSWEIIIPPECVQSQRADVHAALCVVGRRRGVMHVSNNSPLALRVCVFLHVHRVSVWKRNVRPCAETCWKWPLMGRESEPGVLLFHVAPTGTPSTSRAAVCYPSPPGSLTPTIFFFFPSVAFTFSSLPPHTVTPSLFSPLTLTLLLLLCSHISSTSPPRHIHVSAPF